MLPKERYINPFTDFGFKKLFGTEFNKELLIDFLNQVLGEREQIQDLTYLNSEVQGRTSVDRKAFFDLYCENGNGEKFIIELQNVRQQFFKDRSIYYSTFPLQSQAPPGVNWDYQLKAVYTIGILNFSFPDRQEDRYMREIQLLDKDTFEIFYDKLTYIYLEVPEFKKGEEELETHFDKWMYVLKNMSKLQEKPLALQEKIFEKLFSAAEIAKLNPIEMKAYDESLKVLWDNYSVMETMKKGREEGREEGKKEGRKEGRKEGLTEGLTEGALKRELEIATEMKKEGIPLSQITKITGLSKEQIEKL